MKGEMLKKPLKQLKSVVIFKPKSYSFHYTYSFFSEF